MSGESIDRESARRRIAWSPPDEPTGTCGACGADLSEKDPAWVTVTPGGAWCSHHVKSTG